MTLLENWRDEAYADNKDKKAQQKLWERYFLKEKNIYEDLLSDPGKVIEFQQNKQEGNPV